MAYNPNVKNVYEKSKEPTGFINRADSEMAFDNSSLTFTIQPVGAQFEYYIHGVKHTKTAISSVAITDNEGIWYFYFDGPTLSATQTFSPTFFIDYCIVAALYWDSANNQQIYFAEERHGMAMDGGTHGYLHNTVGAAFANGFAITVASVNGDGSSDSHSQISVENGIFYDEDIRHSIVGGLPQTLTPIAQIPVFFKSGASGVWRKKSADNFPVIYSGTAGYAGTGLPYNQWTGSVWQLTELATNNFVLVHFFGTNDINTPIIGIQGITEYVNKPQAVAGAYSEISQLSGLPFSEMIPIGTVIFKTSNSFSNTIKAATVSSNGSPYIDFRDIQGLAVNQVNDHGNLSGLEDQDHPASAIYTSVASFGGNLSSANTTVQSALDAIDDISIANKQLSNLSSTAVNTSLLPGTSAVYGLGSVSSAWADGYFVRAYIESLDRPTTGAITIGSVTATSVDVTPRLNVTAIDSATAGAITIGAATAASLAITPPTAITNTNQAGFEVRSAFEVFKVNTVSNRVLVNGTFAAATPTALFDVRGGDALINGVAVGKGNGSVATATAFGVSALAANTGANNTAIGYQAADVMTSGFANTAIGSGALGSVTTGGQNTAVGFSAAAALISVSGSTAVGYQALTASTALNTAVGSRAGASLTTGSSNTVIGQNALQIATTASQVTAVGNAAAGNISSATANINSTAVGHNSQVGTTSSGQNTVIGAHAGSTGALGVGITTGANLTLLGYNAQPSVNTASNEITLGNSSVTSLRCQVTSITSLSDARDKAEVQDITLGMDFLSTIRPVQFKWDRREWYATPIFDDAGNIIGQTPGVPDGSKKQDKFEGGFIAQELDAAQTAANAEWLNLATKSNPDRMEATPMLLFPIVVKACQELHAKNQQLEARLAALEATITNN